MLAQPCDVVSVGHSVPFDGVDHAGGLYVHYLYRELAAEHELHVFAPTDPRNDAGLAASPPFRATILGPPPGRAARMLAAAVDLLWLRAAPTLPGPTFMLRLKTSRKVRAALAEARVIDVQWTDYAAALPWLRRRRPDAAVVCTMHDVLSDKWRRRAADDPSPVMRARAAVNARVAVRLEKQALRHADHVLVFSEKDAALLEQIHGHYASVRVVWPPLAAGMPVIERSRGPRERNVLFVGAMARPENHASAMWFLERVWGQVVAAVPDATLTIAGSKPQAPLVAAAARAENVTVTGFVEDLAPLREAAAVFAAPVVSGAGIKFKVIDAMLAGLPVVATTTAQEGIGTPDQYVAVTDDPAEFAAATIRALSDPAAMESLGSQASVWAASRFGLAQFRETLAEVYPAVGDDPAARAQR